MDVDRPAEPALTTLVLTAGSLLLPVLGTIVGKVGRVM